MVLVDENPFCVSPDRLLRELRARKATLGAIWKMEAYIEHPDDIERLQRCMSELTGLLRVGGDLSQVAHGVLDALRTMLRADFVYLRLNGPENKPRTEMARIASSFEPQEPREIGAALDRSLGDDATKWPASAQIRVSDSTLSVVPARLGLRGEIGVMVAGSRQLDFPGQTDSLLLSIAANQAAVAFVQQTHVVERGPAKSAAHESEVDARLIVGRIPGIVFFIMTPSGELEVVGSQLIKYFGKTLEQLKHWSTDDTVHPEDRPRVNEVFARAIALGERYEFEARFRRADGVYHWFQCRGRPHRDETGRIARWYCVGIDVDERKRAEEALRTEIAERQRAEGALRESERELRSVVDGIPGFVAILAPNGYIETVNRRILEYCGFSIEELRKWATNGTIHHEDVPHVAETLNRSIASGVPYEIEHRMRRHDGAYLWLRNRGIPVRDDAGQIVRWYVLLTDIEDEKRAEEARRLGEARLAEAERDLQLTVNTIPTLVTAYRHDGSRIFVNRSWQDYSGISLDEAMGSTRWSMVHPDDLERADEEWETSRAAEIPFKSELRLRRADGEYRWHALHRVFARNEAGQIVRWYSAAVDIEDRKRAEEALRTSEAQLKEAQRELQLTINSIPVLVAAYRPDGIRTFVNRTWCDYTGLTQQEVTGGEWKTAFPHFHPDDAGPIERAIRASLVSGEPLPYEMRLRRADGEYRWHSIRRVPLRDDNGTIIRWYSTGFDIQEQKIAEEARRQSEARIAEAERELRVTLDSIPTITWQAGPNGYVQSLNKRWFEYTGTTPEEVRGWRWKLCVHPDDLERLVDIGTEYVATGTPVDGEARLRRFDGEYRWFLFRPAPVRDDAGKIVAWYGSITDIEDRKQAEEAQRASEARLFEAERELRRTLELDPDDDLAGRAEWLCGADQQAGIRLHRRNARRDARPSLATRRAPRRPSRTYRCRERQCAGGAATRSRGASSPV